MEYIKVLKLCNNLTWPGVDSVLPELNFTAAISKESI